MTDKLTLGALAGAVIAISALVAGTKAKAHDWYPPECCSGKDCAPVDEKFIKERADGVHVDIPAGGHPMLKTQGYSAIVPYDSIKVSKDERPHICLGYEGTARFCTFLPPRSF